MYFFFYFYFIQILGLSHIDSAERRVTSIKTQASQLSKMALNFPKEPMAPIFFHVHHSIQNDMQKLEKEIHFIHNTILE